MQDLITFKTFQPSAILFCALKAFSHLTAQTRFEMKTMELLTAGDNRSPNNRSSYLREGAVCRYMMLKDPLAILGQKNTTARLW